MSIVILTKFKNEDHIMYEWINHHFEEGVDQIILIDDNYNNEYLIKNKWLNKYINDKKIIISKSIDPKQDIDYTNRLNLIKNHKWVIIIDMDEFIFSVKKNLKKLLNEELLSYDYIKIRWKLFSHRSVFQPKSVIESNIITHENNDPTSKIGIKCIAKTENLKYIHWHYCEFKKNPVNKITLSAHNQFVQINHYRTQSDEFLFGIKELRGGATEKNRYKNNFNLKYLHYSFDYKCNILKNKRHNLINNINSLSQQKISHYKNSSWFVKNLHLNNKYNIVFVPYRNRTNHLKIFIDKISPMLFTFLPNCKIVIVEQKDNLEFNRGKLLNAAFMEYINEVEYVFFHDIDVIPDKDTIINYYTKEFSILNICSRAKDKFGGVTKIHKNDFIKMNGYPNNIWGWGIEDRSLYIRSYIQNIKSSDLLFDKLEANHYNTFQYSKNIKNEKKIKIKNFLKIIHKKEKKQEQENILNSMKIKGFTILFHKSMNCFPYKGCKNKISNDYNLDNVNKLDNKDKKKLVFDSGLNNIKYKLVKKYKINQIEFLEINL